MQKRLSRTNHDDVADIMHHLIEKLNSVQSNEPTIKECKELAIQLKNAHVDEYMRICERLNKEVYGDIIVSKTHSITQIDDVGIDGLKRIIFEEMGLNAQDIERLSSNE